MTEPNKEIVQERFDPEDIAQFTRISIPPLVRRIYPALYTSKIVTVQPLSEPTGLKYYQQYRYSENKGSQKQVEPFQNQVVIEEVKEEEK